MRQPVPGGAFRVAKPAKVDDERAGVAARDEGGGVREGVELTGVARVGSAHVVGIAESGARGGRGEPRDFQGGIGSRKDERGGVEAQRE